MSEQKEIYLSPTDFFDAVIEAKQEGEITRRLAGMFKLLSEKVANHRYWIRYNHIREDIISENLYACVKGFKNFAPYKDRDTVWQGEDVTYHHLTCNNPHAWFTTCCFNNLRQYMRKYYTELNVHNKMKLEMGLEASEGYLDSIDAIEGKPEEIAEDVEVGKVESPIGWD